MDPGTDLRPGTALGTGPTAALFRPLPRRRTRPGWPRRTRLVGIETTPTLVYAGPAQGGVVWAEATSASIVATPAAVGVAVEAANSLVTAMAETVTILLIILMIRMQLARLGRAV
jgi:hypothetical protein